MSHQGDSASWVLDRSPLEMGQLFVRLGSAVTFITRGEVASREESETSATLCALLEDEGARVVTHAAVNAIERGGCGPPDRVCQGREARGGGAR